MIYRTILLISIITINSVAQLYSQDIEINDNQVLIDKKPVLKCEKINATEYSFYTLDKEDELLMIKFYDNGTPKYLDDDYFVLNFLIEKVKIESKNIGKVIQGLGLNANKNMKKLIEWLVKEKVLTTEGQINIDKLDVFKQKYHEQLFH